MPLNPIRICLLVLLPFLSLAQATTTDSSTKIYYSKVLKKGFYKNADEFLNNSPSILRDFSVQKLTRSNKKQAAGIMAVDYKLTDGEEHLREKIWGFCDGDSVYIKQYFFENQFWKLECLGPYPFYIRPEFMVKESLYIAGLAGAAAILANPSFEIYMLNSKGKFKKLYTEDALELFGPEPDIRAAFRYTIGPDIGEPNAKRSAITREYLIKFNQRLISKGH